MIDARDKHLFVIRACVDIFKRDGARFLDAVEVALPAVLRVGAKRLDFRVGVAVLAKRTG